MGLFVLSFLELARVHQMGQIVLLRRMAGKPVRVEGYFTGEIVAGEVNEDTFMEVE
jgi:hypothetical protein